MTEKTNTIIIEYMKKVPLLFCTFLVMFGCAPNPLTKQRNMAFISNAMLFPMAFAQYDEFLQENNVVSGTRDAEMVTRVGNRIVEAAQKLLTAHGEPDYFKDYQWQFTLVEDKAINAWAMPGGKVAFYTGILPVTQSEGGLAVVMGHEVAHIILNHGQQRISADLLKQLGAMGVSIAVGDSSPEVRSMIMTAFGIGSTLFGTLPFSRKHEIEADEYGLLLMTIAGYDPEEGARFWERMIATDGSGTVEFLSTHPSPPNRVKNLRSLVPEVKQKAAEFGGC